MVNLTLTRNDRLPHSQRNFSKKRQEKPQNGATCRKMVEHFGAFLRPRVPRLIFAHIRLSSRTAMDKIMLHAD
jgi:hypothetical protein